LWNSALFSQDNISLSIGKRGEGNKNRKTRNKRRKRCVLRIGIICELRKRFFWSGCEVNDRGGGGCDVPGVLRVGGGGRIGRPAA
jgi:hypothetical protein